MGRPRALASSHESHLASAKAWAYRADKATAHQDRRAPDLDVGVVDGVAQRVAYELGEEHRQHQGHDDLRAPRTGCHVMLMAAIGCMALSSMNNACCKVEDVGFALSRSG